MTPSIHAPDMADLPDARVVEAAAQAVASRRNVLVTAAPGIGPTMLARRIPGILPPLDDHARTWLHAEYDGAGLLRRAAPPPSHPPFRAPHHTVTDAALVGTRTLGAPRGVRLGRAGELQLARFGVLFVDELIEFRLQAIRALARALRFMTGAPLVIGSTHPCPCGWRGSDIRVCSCSDAAVAFHAARVRRYAALLHLDAAITMRALTLAQLREHDRTGPTSAQLRRRLAARA